MSKPTHRFDALRESAREAGGGLAEQVATQRRQVLASLGALADALAVPGGAAVEGLDTGDLVALRPLGLRLAAADARLAD